LARTRGFAGILKSRLADRSVEAEVRFFHQQIEDVFTLACGNRVGGSETTRQARAILLQEILLPYDALLGRKKRHDTLRELSVAARGRFGQWVASSGAVPPDRHESVLFAFQRLTEILEHERQQASKEWDDPRLVWLPLQYALLPEDADEQIEIDSLIERVTGLAFTDHNHITYAANLQFHWELLQMIKETKHYHVLWIHDFPAATNDSGLDWASLEVVRGYLAALTDRVVQYDSTRTLPSYFIFLDQHYYEQRKSRVWMRVLEDPLRASTSLPFGSPADREALAEAVQRLRTAVLNSRVLQAEAREYGDAWLSNRIKVHVNITNRVDASFWGGGLISSVFGYPDDVMRDHRKMAFRDVSEDDPFGGVAILTGMGVGQQYLGPGWDDRSLILQGPVLLELKRAARELLLSQGLVEANLPLPLRALPRADDVLALLAALPDASRFDARALVLVNGTGYLPKPLNAAKALLYSLMPRGSVIKVPDSLWNSTFYAGLLVGASLRGAHVLIIAPARENAPSSGFPQMARAYELLTRLLLVRDRMGEAIAAAGGELRIGLYALPLDQHGFSSRAERWARQMDSTPFLRTLLPFAPALEQMVAEAGRDSSDLDHSTVPLQPKLHQKVQFLATGEFWHAITASPEWPRFMATYLRYRRATYSPTERYAAARDLPDTLDQIARRLILAARTTPRAASFAFLGSQNQDYRGMFMDGEVSVLFTGATSLVPLVDLVFMVGTVTWIDDQATLDRLLPPVGELQRRIARITKDGV
jgi:phosphatidylserine/phosphatidylglycerophosphate/cardiolipin synthase-like enzyme